MVKLHAQRIKRAIQSGAYRLTNHAENEREADTVSVSELEEAFSSVSLEILEEYPDDPRGNSCLILGFTKAGLPLHAVIGLSNLDVIILITLYRPDPSVWYDWHKRLK